MTKWYSAVILVAVLSASAAVAQTSVGSSLLQVAGLFQSSASYTSLAFADPQKLPEQLTSPRATIPVSFVIKNASDTSRTYGWSVLLTHTGHSKRLSGYTSIGAGKESTVRRVLRFSCVGGRFHVVVKLATPTESIGFWTDCWSSRGRTP